MSLRWFPVDLVPDVPAEPAAAALVSRAAVLTIIGKRSMPATRQAIVTVARAIATGAWS